VLLDTMNSVLNYAKLEASTSNERTKQQLIVKGEFNLRQLITDTLQMFKNIANEKDIKLQFDYNSQTELLYSDAVSLRTVFNNLISNACKFTRQGTITVKVSNYHGHHHHHHSTISNSSSSSSLSTSPISSSLNLNSFVSLGLNSNILTGSFNGKQVRKSLCIQVSDTGIGIDPAFAANIFKPFSQQDSQTSRSFGGTGLGLAISKHIIELLEGSISFTSEAGKGTTFTIILPIVEPPSPQQELHPTLEKASPSEPISTNNNNNNNNIISGLSIEDGAKNYFATAPSSPMRTANEDFGNVNVLVVDDNTINTRVFSKMLSDLNVRHLCVNSGMEALNEFASGQQHFNLVLLDIEMPVMSGLECAKLLRETQPHKLTTMTPAMAQQQFALSHIHGVRNNTFKLYFVTGYERSSIGADYLKLADGYIQKPIRMKTLKEILRSTSFSNQFINCF